MHQAADLWLERSDRKYSNRGGAMAVRELWSPDYLTSIMKHQAHHSMYAYFQEDLLPFLGREGAMNSSFGGLYHMKHVILDIDGKEARETLVETRSLVYYILNTLKVDEKHIHVFFSGRKGYHIYLDAGLFGLEPSNSLPALVKGTVMSLFKHPMLDVAPLNPSGLIRAPFSLHTGSGWSKEYVPIDVLFEEDAWEYVAETERTTEEKQEILHGMYAHTEVDPILISYTQYELQKEKKGAKTSFSSHDPTHMVTCMQHLLARGPEQGRRHTDALRLSSWLFRGGIPEDAAERVLSGWMDTEDTHKVVAGSYAKGYSYSCNDTVMKEFCDPRCVFQTKKDYSMEVQGSQGLGESLLRYTKMLNAGKGFDLYDLYGIETDQQYRIVPCEALLLIADTGMGKSLLVQDWLRRLQKRTIYVNLEMPEHLVSRRFLQSQNNMEKQQVLDKFSQGIDEKMLRSIGWLNLMSDTTTLPMVEKAVQRIRPEIVVVDTTDGISVPEAGNNSMWHLKSIVQGLRHIAERYQTIVIGIHHISKSGSREVNGEFQGKARSMTLNDATGNRDAVTKADHVFALEGIRKSPIRTLRSLKSRDEEDFETQVVMKWTKQRVYFHKNAHVSEQLNLLLGEN